MNRYKLHKGLLLGFFGVLMSTLAHSQSMSITQNIGDGPTCLGESVNYNANVSGYTGSYSCIRYNWTVSNNGTIIGGSDDHVIVRWNNGTSGTVTVSAFNSGGAFQDEEGFGGPDTGDGNLDPCDGQPALILNASIDPEINQPATGGLTVSTTFTGRMCSGDQATLKAVVSGDMVFEGWYLGNSKKSSSINYTTSTPGSYQAKGKLTSVCNNQTITRYLTIGGPRTYTSGDGIGDRTAFKEQKIAGQLRILNSSIPLDRWLVKRGNGNWETYQIVSSANRFNHVLNYTNLLVNETTQIRGRAVKDCSEQEYQYTDIVTISVTEYVPDYSSITSTQYGESNVVIGKSRNYFDQSGKNLQSQSLNVENNDVFVSEPLYDEYERPVGRTLSAPVGNSELVYKSGFATVNDAPLSHMNWDGNTSTALDNSTPNTLGYFHSSNNTTDGNRMAETRHPYVVSNFYPDGSGEKKTASQPGDFHYISSGKTVIQKTLPMLEGELRDYAALRNLLIGQNVLPARIVKQVTNDPNGRESIIYLDEAQRVIATAVGGNNTVVMRNKLPSVGKRVEFHVPNTGSKTHVSFASGGRRVKIFDLVNNVEIYNGTTSSKDLDPGFYSLTMEGGLGPIPQDLSYSANYTDFTYNFFDNMGRMVASMTPKATQHIFNATVPNISSSEIGDINVLKDLLPYTTFYSYDFQGRLVAMTEPDAGKTEYVYRIDGLIRFSQNAEQAADPDSSRFSVTSYDDLGRPIMSGEYKAAWTESNVRSFNNYFSDPNGTALAINESGYFGGDYGDWIKTFYDYPKLPLSTQDPDFATEFPDLSQDFVQGAVSSTESESFQSWYSYDEQGRVVWFLQYIKALDKYFLIQYVYDFLGNVLKVKYQPQTAQDDVREAFYHQYIYDGNQQLKTVETSDDDVNWYLHARYEYYKHGPLKRVELAENMQGIDYTYTPQGWLKAINHPVRALDPGKDNQSGEHASFHEDIFGMTLEYFEGDYARSDSKIGSLDLDDKTVPEQYGGNIRATIFGEGTTSGYSSSYQQADAYNYPATKEYATSISSNITANAEQRITLKKGFNSNGRAVALKVVTDNATSKRKVSVDEGEVYAYTYDNKYQLDEADYSKDGTNTNSYDVDVNGYDENGNIDKIERYGDNPASLRDNFDLVYSYQLPATDPDYSLSNRLVRVIHPSDASQNYIEHIGYNAIGQVISIDYTDVEMTDISVTYDATGKVTHVVDLNNTSNTLMEITYDDRGFRMMKRVNGVENWYIRDASGQVMAIYNKQDGEGNPVSQIELPIYGGSRLGMAYRNPDHYKYIYELTDHLGNVRAIVTKLGLQATATMEAENEAYEAQFFDNTNPHPNKSRTGSKSSLTNSENQLGPSTTFRVKAGDEVMLEVFATYDDTESFNEVPITASLLGNLINGANGGVIGAEGSGFGGGVNDNINDFLGAVVGNQNEPKAYLQYVILDEQFNRQQTINLSDTYRPVTGNFDQDENYFERLALNLTVPEDGYIYAYIVNESDQNIHFDDFTFQVIGTRAIRKTDYYPFGAVAKVWKNPDQTQNETYRHGYQGQYAEEDTTTGWSAFELRMYDPLIGRWLQVDPERQFSSPYNAMGNNPLNRVDPTGGESPPWLYKDGKWAYVDEATYGQEQHLWEDWEVISDDPNFFGEQAFMDWQTHFGRNTVVNSGDVRDWAYYNNLDRSFGPEQSSFVKETIRLSKSINPAHVGANAIAEIASGEDHQGNPRHVGVAMFNLVTSAFGIGSFAKNFWQGQLGDAIFGASTEYSGLEDYVNDWALGIEPPTYTKEDIYLRLFGSSQPSPLRGNWNWLPSYRVH